MKAEQKNVPINILLADDDSDDCFFFEKALKDLPLKLTLKIVRDGEQLMEYLSLHVKSLPDILFLDLSMPRKTGFECLTEIKEDESLKDLAVVMFTTSFSRDLDYEKEMIKMLYGIGAQDFIRKPSDFTDFKEVIHKSLIKIVKIKSL